MAMRGGESWDLLLSLDVSPIALSAGGFACGCCPSDEREVFPSLEALWRDHLFDPLLVWINTDLALAKAIALFRSGGATWARLIMENGDGGHGAAIVVPL
ncbi:MAG: hypothetical protein M3Y22_00950 [Pseudomonadota bacterium]|nr:hypothetical protein [Pseudomonadota bacterium]